MADQAPALPGPGPEPIPHAADAVMTAGIIKYDVADLPGGIVGVPAGVMGAASGGILQESGYAHDMNAGVIGGYATADIKPVYVGGDADAGGRDDVSGTVAGSVAAADARFTEIETDTHAQGSMIGDLMTFPPSQLDPGAGPGLTLPAGAYYDPPRNYGD